MKLPARFIAGNLVWGRDASVWAVFAVEPVSYPWLPRHEKLQLHQQTRAALRTLTGNAIVLRGGAATHGSISGVAHFAAESEEECLALIRELMTFLPQNNLDDPPVRPTTDPSDRVDEEMQTVVPDQKFHQ